MKITIRQETTADFPTIFQLVAKAFEKMEFSNQTEQFLVEKLRNTDAYIPELALVAKHDQKIIGYIILTKIHIDNGSQLFDALSLGPVAVLPKFHGQGIGSQLIRAAHNRAKDLGHERIILLGHKDYYPRFGYEWTSKHNIELPFAAPKEHCMVISLTPKGLEGVSGKVIYSKPFLE